MSRIAIALSNVATVLAILTAPQLTFARETSPNVILVITDDQGYGDVGAHGNKMIETPNLDKLHKQSVRLTDFHVDPTCSPTRSALMTGRYSTRTGVWHTIQGRSLMSTNELTVAEVFQQAGYRTGMFGKWHLGDNYPCRPQDQGFDDTFYNGGGGVTQTPDYFDNDYFDDTYFRNGVPEKATGYCTDVWFDNAMQFIEKQKDRPFFCYLTTNAPHGPFLVAEEYSKPYEEKGVPATMAKFYGMITNIDDNMGRLMKKLQILKLADNTILIFMTDNGTAAGVVRNRRGKNKKNRPKLKWLGFNDGMRGQKGSPYDGGHRVPFFIRWPNGGIGGGRDVEQLTAHIDVLPTLADLCGLKDPKATERDGISLKPLLQANGLKLAERTLFVHSQRIEFPVKWRQSAVMTERWRLVNGSQLFDIQSDHGQKKDVAGQHPEAVAKLRQAYDGWWKSLSPVFGEYVRIRFGNDAENPVRLTCHDWHTNDKPVPWNHGHIRRGLVANGFWAIDVVKSGKYEITLRRWPEYIGKPIEANKASLKIGGQQFDQTVDPDQSAAKFTVNLDEGQTRLQTYLTMPNGKTRGAYYVSVKFVR